MIEDYALIDYKQVDIYLEFPYVTFITHAPRAFGGSGHYPREIPRSLHIKRRPSVVSLQRRDRCPRRGFHE